jgi:hypothetical protein
MSYLANSQSRAPCVTERVQANLALLIHIAVIDFSAKHQLGRLHIPSARSNRQLSRSKALHGPQQSKKK